MSFAVQFRVEPLLQPKPGLNRVFVLMADFPVNINGDEHVVPQGFETDLASIPAVVQALLANDDPRILRAAIIHDQLCDERGDIWPDHRRIYSSLEAAEIFRAGMLFDGASEPVANLCFFNVATFGPHWK